MDKTSVREKSYDLREEHTESFSWEKRSEYGLVKNGPPYVLTTSISVSLTNPNYFRGRLYLLDGSRCHLDSIFGFSTNSLDIAKRKAQEKHDACFRKLVNLERGFPEHIPEDFFNEFSNIED